MDSVTKLRMAEGAEICEGPDEIWVRGSSLGEPLARLLRRHPHARRFWILSDNQLISPERLVPLGHLPDGPWSPLRDWLTIDLPSAQFAPHDVKKLSLRLVRSSEAQESNLIVTDIQTWLEYGSTAPQVRLDCWIFAAAAHGSVVVWGLPLPSMRGTRFVESSGIAVPAGFTWSPRVAPEILKESLKLDERDVALWQEEGACELIRGDQFVRATRTAIRSTAREVGDG